MTEQGTTSRDDTASAPRRVAIVGGGLAGSLLALALSERGYGVDVYERREDPRVDGAEGGRSINLGLSKRGIQALTEVGLIDVVMPLTVVMRARAPAVPAATASPAPVPAAPAPVVPTTAPSATTAKFKAHAAGLSSARQRQ